MQSSIQAENPNCQQELEQTRSPQTTWPQQGSSAKDVQADQKKTN